MNNILLAVVVAFVAGRASHVPIRFNVKIKNGKHDRRRQAPRPWQFAPWAGAGPDRSWLPWPR